MDYTNLYIKTIVDGTKNQPNRISKRIPTPKPEWVGLYIATCDEDGSNIVLDKSQRISVSEAKENIFLNANPNDDVYYRIMPIIKEGNEEIVIQDGADNTSNIVKIDRIKRIISYSFEPAKKGGFLRKASPAKLQISCEGLIDAGTVGLMISGVFVPLPAFSGTFIYENETMEQVNVQLNSKVSKGFTLIRQ